MSLLGETHPEERRFGDTVGDGIGVGSGRGNPRSGDEGWAPLEEEQGRDSGSTSAPEAEEILPAVEGVVEVLEGESGVFSLGPLGDAGVGAPPALAHREPELGVGGAERAHSLRSAG